MQSQWIAFTYQCTVGCPLEALTSIPQNNYDVVLRLADQQIEPIANAVGLLWHNTTAKAAQR